jgi:predicted amidohydrolase
MYAVGRALVTGPVDKISGSNDGIVAQAITDEEEMLIVELDHELLHRSRATPEPPGLGLRRTELYAGLISTPELLA